MTAYLTPIAVIIGFIGWAIVNWKIGTDKAKSEASANWESAYKATNERLKQVEEKLAVVETKYRAIEKENLGLTKEVNILKQVQPSKVFEEKIALILEELKRQREDFLSHASADAEQFNNMWQYMRTTNDVALDNNAMLKKICKEG